MIKLPSSKWAVTNSSDIFGILQRTRNMDFDQDGYAKLAKRSRNLYSIASSANFDRVTAIQYYNTFAEYYFFTRLGLFKMGADLTITDLTAASNAPSSDDINGTNDLCMWQGYLYATSGRPTPGTYTLRRLESVWTTSKYSLVSNGPMVVHEGLNYLAIAQNDSGIPKVILLDTNHSLIFTLVLPSEFQITTMEYSNGYILIGTRNINNGEAKVFHWDGKTAAYNADYGVRSYRANSVKRYQNSYAVLNSKGQLLKFNGGGYTPLDTLPVYAKDVEWDLDGSSPLGRVIHRGMVVDKDLIYINVSPRILLKSTDTAAHILENWFEGGVWCYDPKVGLYHRYSHTSSLRSKETIATSSVNATTNIITVASAPVTGTPTMYDSAGGTAMGGLVNRTKYYAIYVSATTIKLATTRANALVETAIDITGTGNSSQFLVYLPNRDFGGSPLGGDTVALDSGCAITLIANRANTFKSDATRVLFGTGTGATTTTLAYGLAVASYGQENRGHVVTVKANSVSLTDTFQNFTIKYSGVKTAEDVIIPKYRFIERTDTLTGIDQALTQTATWLNTTKFTTTADISAAKVGDEISFHSGSGSGYTAHISALSLSGATYTVTVDEIIQNITGGDTVAFVIENWNKCNDPITTADNDYFTNANGDRYASDSGVKTFSFVNGGKSKWVELKIELRGEDVRLEEILINNKPFQTFIK